MTIEYPCKSTKHWELCISICVRSQIHSKEDFDEQNMKASAQMNVTIAMCSTLGTRLYIMGVDCKGMLKYSNHADT